MISRRRKKRYCRNVLNQIFKNAYKRCNEFSYTNVGFKDGVFWTPELDCLAEWNKVFIKEIKDIKVPEGYMDSWMRELLTSKKN